MNKKAITCICAFAASVCFSLATFSFGAAADGVGILKGEDGVSAYAAYNLNNGDGEIKSYSYRNITNEKTYESFGCGYGGYFNTRNRWQEAPLLLETEAAGTNSDYLFGELFSGSFTFVGRGIQTLYSDAGEKERDYDTLAFVFDDGEQTIDIRFTQSGTVDYILAEVFYCGDSVVCETSKIKTSLCGKYEGKDYPLYLSFESTSGKLTTRNDDGRSEDTVICDLTPFGYTPMKYYGASVSFRDGKQSVTDSAGKEYPAKGRLLVYELCGQPTTGIAVNTQGATITCFDNLERLYLGAKYTPCPAVAYDILDGDISASVEIAVFDPDGNSVALSAGRFFAEMTGLYVLTYSVTDSGGITASVEYTVEVVDALPRMTCTLLKNYPETCGLYEKIYIIPASVERDGKETAYNVVVMKDGTPIDSFGDEERGWIGANEAGIYTIVYVAPNGVGLFVPFAYEVECLDTAGFILDDIPTEIPYNVEYNFGEPSVTYNGQLYAPTIEIESPNGGRTVLDGYTFTPTEFGEYTIRFSAEIEGHSHERTFRTESIFTNRSLLRANSGFESQQDDYSVTVYDRKVTSGSVAVTKTLAEKSGVLLSGKAADQTFRFVNPINLNELSPTTPIVKLFVPADNGYASLNALELRLVDKYNSANYVSVYYSQHVSLDYYCYVRAGANGRQYGRSNEAAANGQIWTYLYGTVAMNSLCGSANNQPVYGESKNNAFGFYFDYANKSISIDNARDWGFGEFYTVVDLDDPDMVGADRWSGFTTGEAYLEVVIPGSVTKTAAIVVLEVAGQSLGGEEVIDTVAPIIGVAAEYAPDSMPEALVGKRYDVPAATAWDLVCGETEVNVKVVASDGSELEITDGYVFPSETGGYSIVYTAIDIFENVATKVYRFVAVSEIEEITMQWETEPGEYTAGQTIIVPEIFLSGGSGKIKNVGIRILYNGREIVLPASRSLKLTEAGTIVFELVNAEDYLETPFVKTSLTIFAAAPQTATIYVGGIPERYVAGNMAYLPKYSAIDYAFRADEDEYYPSVNVYVNGKLVTGDVFTVPAVGYTELKFTAGSGLRNVEKIFSVETVKPEALSDYFSADGDFDGKLSDDGLIVTTTANNPVTFINPVVYDSLNLSINLAKTIQYYCADGSMSDKICNIPDAVTITLTDYYDEEYKLTIRILPYSKTQSYLEINNSGEYNKIKGSFSAAKTSIQSFKLLLKREGVIQDVRSSLSFSFDSFTNGEKFDGFPSGLVKISFGVEAMNDASILINQISNQIFDGYSYEYGDSTAPVLLLEEKMESGVVMKGEEIVVSAAKAYDVLNMYGTVTLRVLVPRADGTIAVLYDGIGADRSFTLQTEYYGLYTVEYTLLDEYKNREVRTFKYTVRDTVAPTITVDGTLEERYAVGDEMKIPDIFVTSSIDPAPVYVVMIYNSSTRYEVVTGQSSVILKKGDFKLVIYAYDSDYNISVVEYTFVVE